MNKFLLNKAFVFLSVLFISTLSYAQRYSPPPPASRDLERRVSYMERTVQDLNYRLQKLEYGSGNPVPREYYCIAKCAGSSATAGGRGRSESEAKQAAFEELRKSWTCTMEITECSSEN